MAIKSKKWSPWPQPAATVTRKYSVVVKPMKLEFGEISFDNYLKELDKEDGGGRGIQREKAMEIMMRWNGEVKSGGGFGRPFNRRRYKECSGETFVKKGKPVTWDDEFQNVCDFTVVSTNGGGGGEIKFLPWDVSFKLQYGEYRGKKSAIGKATLNLAEITSKESVVVTKLPILNLPEITSKESVVVTKLPVDLHIAGVTRPATLSVLVIFMEVGNGQEPALLVRNASWFGGMGRNGTWSTAESQSTSSSSDSLPEPVKKVGFFSWKRRRLSFGADRTKVEPLTTSGPLQAENDTVPYGPKKDDGNNSTGKWEAKELTSRDGNTKLNTNVFFASFDQCSNKAAGDSACTALVTVIAHWLHSNQQAMPTRQEFENLIVEGSSEWRKLCTNESYVSQFPNKHFDLETVLHAGIRPITVLPQKSFVGFFSPEKFDVLKEAMSFDGIWTEIGRHSEESRIYVISWNDHFFVLKADADAYYIIDTLGERLFEGCTQAYILKFDDDSSLMVEGNTEEKIEESYQGKDCCREFIKRFLAAIPLRELELDEEKAAVPYYSLHHRLQIEFNFSTTLPASTSLSSA